MQTVISRNHYGLHAESRAGKRIFRTMRTFSGAIVTSVWSVLDGNGSDMLCTTPTGEKIAHPDIVKRLTAKKLAEMHKENIVALGDKLMAPVNEAQSIFSL